MPYSPAHYIQFVRSRMSYYFPWIKTDTFSWFTISSNRFFPGPTFFDMLNDNTWISLYQVKLFTLSTPDHRPDQWREFKLCHPLTLFFLGFLLLYDGIDGIAPFMELGFSERYLIICSLFSFDINHILKASWRISSAYSFWSKNSPNMISSLAVQSGWIKVRKNGNFTDFNINSGSFCLKV